jgi:hypothetical protein
MMWWVASTEWLHRAWSTTAWRSARSCRFVFDTVCILREIRRFVGHCDPEARALAVRSCFTDDVMSVRACTWVGCRAISRTWLQPAGSLRNERPSAAGAAGCVYERKSATTRPRNRTIAAHVDCDPALGVHPPDVGVHLKGSCCARVPRARDSARAEGSLAAVEAAGWTAGRQADAAWKPRKERRDQNDVGCKPGCAACRPPEVQEQNAMASRTTSSVRARSHRCE